MNKIEAFSTHLLGSLPRSLDLLKIKRMYIKDKSNKDLYMAKILSDTKEAVSLQEKYDIDIITNGEFSRDNYVSFISEKIEGVVMMNMSDMLEYIDDKKAFEKILETLDVPSVAIKNAICNGRLKYKDSLVADEMRVLKTLTNRKIKATLPGAYLMTRSMWLPKLSGEFYESKDELKKDVLAILKREIDELVEIGVDVVQFDEPVLTEVVFSKGQTRSFMCAALSEKKDPKEELEFATALIKEIVDYAKAKGIICALHVCRGNWSKNEDILLSGPYTPLLPLFEEVLPDILCLEYSTKRAFDISLLFESEILKEKIVLGLGVINPRLDDVESLDDIVSEVKEALKYVPASRILLNPDCGFATFANRPVNTYDIIEEKLAVLQKAKEYLRTHEN